MPLNNALFANPQLFQAMQNDPRLAMAQGLMQQGSSTAPVRSPLEGLARALQGGLGGFQAGRVRKGYEAQDDQYREALIAALKNPDAIAGLQNSGNSTLQQMAMDAKLKQALDPAKDPLLQVYDPNSKSMVYKPQSQAVGQQAAAPEQPKAPTTRQVGDPSRPGVILDQEFDPNTPGGWKTVGQRLPEPKQGPETWHTVMGPDGKPAYLESSLGNQKELPGKKGGADVETFAKVNTMVKPYVDAASNMAKSKEQVNVALDAKNGTGDTAAIIAFNKLLDEGAVVREADVALTRAAVSVAEQAQAWVNQARTGEIMPQDLRDRIRAITQSFYETGNQYARERVDGFRAMSQDAGVNFDQIVTPGLSQALGWSQPLPAGGPQGPRVQKKLPPVLTYNPQTGQME